MSSLGDTSEQDYHYSIWEDKIVFVGGATIIALAIWKAVELITLLFVHLHISMTWS